LKSAETALLLLEPDRASTACERGDDDFYQNELLKTEIAFPRQILKITDGSPVAGCAQKPATP
jgi:hypothetical protein